MARRKLPYPEKPYKPSEEAKRRLATLMEPEQREKLQLRIHEDWQPKGGWQLWHWVTLEDVKFD